MEIHVISSVGTGNTQLSAFDNALSRAGILNYNIITLSSVIPKDARVVKKKTYHLIPDQIGLRLYVVAATIRTKQLDTTIGAGIGWYVFDEGGVFVEHETEGTTPASVREELVSDIYSSLSDLCKNRKKAFQKNRANYELAICPPKPTPRCALTIAVYKAELW